jgi:prepilin-type N-terminal cleavage/methylation domain-containing protein
MKGFSLVETMVSVAIISSIMSVVLWTYSTFNDNISLSSAGQEVAIAIREAQTYGLTVREVTPGSGNFNSAYGIVFDPTDLTHYSVFADLNSNKVYDSGEDVDKFTLKNGVTITAICDNTNCPPHPDVKNLNITFLRPNPDAYIAFANNGGGIFRGAAPIGKVVLTSHQGKNLTVIVTSTGQVTIQ